MTTSIVPMPNNFVPVAPPAIQPKGGIPGDWTLAFNDEFETFDSTRWTPYWFTDGNTMNNVGCYASNVSVVGGQLELTLSSSAEGALVSTNPGDGIAGHVGFEFLYGYAEASITFPSSGSTLVNWPAWWTEVGDWENGEEFDIAEILGGYMTTNYHSRVGGVDTGENSGTISGDWTGRHTYGMLWEPGLQTMYFDGVEVYSRSVRETGMPEYLILNHGSSGTVYAGTKVYVDYVRVWTLG